jgi:hypothetical protein
MGRPAIIWTPEMIETLREMRAAGIQLLLCAERIGVAYTTALFKGPRARDRRADEPWPSHRPAHFDGNGL